MADDTTFDLDNGPHFSGLFLTYMVVASFLAIASLVFWALRQWTWRRYGIYIDVQAIQFSLLGGRIFFVGLRYHGNNETILIQNGHVTWSYWIRRVRHINIGKPTSGKDVRTDDVKGANAHGHSKAEPQLPCRVNLAIAGLEWFVYNRSAAYDSIIAGLTTTPVDSGEEYNIAEHDHLDHDNNGMHKLRKRHTKEHDNGDSSRKGKSDEKATGLSEEPDLRFSSADSYEHGGADGDRRKPGTDDADKDALPVVLQLFPIHFTCDKAAVVMGNENTSAILIVKAQSLSGEIDAVETQTPDPYRQLFKIRFIQPVIEMKDNDDYREDQVSRAVREKAAREKDIAKESRPLPRRSFFHHQRRAAVNQLRNILPYFRRSVESFNSTSPGSAQETSASAHMPGSGHWQGLSRYLDGPDGDEKTRWASTEYAILNPILESPEAVFTMYWDSVGKVTSTAVAVEAIPSGPAKIEEKLLPKDHEHNINGFEPPPAWGMALSVRGGSINYGPWADRKRAELQRVFFPGLSKDAEPAKNLPVGALRVPTQFKMYVELDEEVTLRVPLRESSKNWRFKNKDTNTKFRPARDKRRARSRFKKSEPAGAAPSQRPYGWLDIKIAANATISYSMDMAASSTGFSSILNLDLPKVEISSSVNQQVLWRSAGLQVSCDLSTPLKWNDLRHWHFHISSHELELFLLRDHVYLITDLIDDWGSGPPSPYLVFTPFKYSVNLCFLNVKIYLNVNDANIINNPTSLDDNAFIIISSPLLEAALCIPLDRYRPPSNAIPFTVQTASASIGLHVPTWNTQTMFCPCKDVGHLKDLLVDGKYHYCATTSAGNTDTLILNVSGREPTFWAHGFVVRYFLKLKDNYFGDDVHFKTLEEYQDSLLLKEANPEAELATRPPHKSSNDMDVVLSVHTDDPKLFLPANLYSASRHVQLTAAYVAADLRFTNYYMDLDFVLSPLSMSQGSDSDDDKYAPDASIDAMPNTQLFIDGIHVYGNRLFGLPPTEPTYLCNWDISVGAVSGECTTDFLTALMNGGKSFGFTFDDDENALVAFSSVVMYDVTFLRANVKSVKLWLHLDEAAFLLSLSEGVDVKYNDWARTHYSKRADISIPDLQLSCVNLESAMRHRSRLHIPVETDAHLKTGLSIAIISRKFDFSSERRMQQKLLQHEDQRTNRVGFLLLPAFLEHGFVPDKIEPPAQPVPLVPQPVTSADIEEDGISLSTESMANQSQRRMRHQKSRSSFLSVSATSQRSVIRAQGSILSSSKSKHSAQDQHEFNPLPLIEPQATDQSGHLSASHRRDVSSSTRHSGFYRATGDFADGGSHKSPCRNMSALHSQFSAPNFPLDDINPDMREATLLSLEKDEQPVYGGAGRRCSSGDSFDSLPTDFNLGDVDPDMLSEDRLHSSVLIRVREGVSAFLNPTSVKHIASLISVLEPHGPEDILDAVQMSSVGDIASAINHRNMKGQIADFAIQLPEAHLRLLNCSNSDSASSSRDEKDQYDVSVSRVTFMSRATTTWDATFGLDRVKTKNSFQLRLGSLGLSASERFADMTGSQAAFTAELSDVLISLGNRDLTYLDADVGAIEAQLSSERIGYIASLVDRTGALTATIAEYFSGPLSYGDRVRPLLARRLIAAGKGVPDPSFLVRPSAVLRSANEHLRTFDSWKLAVRLRQIWSLMKHTDKVQLIRDCIGCEESPSSGGPCSSESAPTSIHDVLSSLDRWRGWDLTDVGRSILLRKLFGDLAGNPSKAAKTQPVPLPFMAVTRLQRLQMILDPGLKQNEIQFLDLTVRFENNAPTSVGSATGIPTLVAGKASSKSISVLNIYCADSAIRLNWEICELVEDILKLYNLRMQEMDQLFASKTKAKSRGKNDLTKNPASAPASNEQTFHIVLAMDRAAIILDTINLNIRMFSGDLKASLLLRQNRLGAMDTNVVMSGDSITSRIKSHSELLMSSEWRGPSIFVSYDTPTTNGKCTPAFKATASSRDFFLDVMQDPIVLMEILDLLVRDEFAQIYRLKAQLPVVAAAADARTEALVSDAKTSMTDRFPTFYVKIALFLDHYVISLPLLRSLTYIISGVVARVSTTADFGREFIFDFDVKENSHDMQVSVNNAPRSVSLLQIPPTNGRITTQISDVEQIITVFSSLELVQLDASAVYSLLSALNRPEISNTVTDMQQQLKIIQNHLTEILRTDEQPVQVNSRRSSASKTHRQLIYSVHSTFAGLEIFGNSPLKTDVAPLAHLSFCLDSVKLEVSNRLENGGPVLPYPELYINLRRIAFEIMKGTEESMSSCGSVVFAALITATSRLMDDGTERRSLAVKSDGFDASFSPETVSTVVDVLGYMGDKIKDLDTSREIEYLRKLRQSKPRITINAQEEPEEGVEPDIIDAFLSSMAYSFEVKNIQVNWLCALTAIERPLPAYFNGAKKCLSPSAAGKEDLVLLLGRIELGTRNRNSARLTIENFQLQMVPPTQDKRARSPISALLPEVIFSVAYFSTHKTRRFAFQAIGKSLDVRLSSEFIVPVTHLKESIQLSIKNVRQASHQWKPAASPNGASFPVKRAEAPKQPATSGKRLESFLVDMDFAGAVVHISGKKHGNYLPSHFAHASPEDASRSRTSRRPSVAGKYGQFNPDESGGSTVLRSPGLVWKARYQDNGREDPSLYAEVRVDASSNVLYPSVVPLAMDMTASIKEVVKNSDSARFRLDEQEEVDKQGGPVESPDEPPVIKKAEQEESILSSAANRKSMLGRLKLNLGLRVCRQQFSLSCQPIARVAATASFDDFYLTANTVQSAEQGTFFAVSGNLSGLRASVQHVYSRESTGSFEVQSMVLSLMNSRHVSGVKGMSALLKVSPMKVSINAKQLQDFLLFREIWTTRDLRNVHVAPDVAERLPETASLSSSSQQQTHLVQRYQQVAATAAFPWTATLAISALEINVDLGQALGKSVFSISNLWVSSKKTSDWEQNLCLGIEKVNVENTGRMSGFVSLDDLKLRTSIEWPARVQALNETPLVQASVNISQLRLKVSFDYQAFLVADITKLEFLMYNVRRRKMGRGDRLVAIFDCDSVQVVGTTASAAQGVALYQAILRLVQERKANFEASLREIERFIRRRSSAPLVSAALAEMGDANKLAPSTSVELDSSKESIPLGITAEDHSSDDIMTKSPISLDTDVVVTLKTLNLGVFPNSFTEHQVLKMEAMNAQARFTANMENKRIHSNLGLTLGQLRIGLAGVRHIHTTTRQPDGPPKTVNDLSVEDVVLSVTGSRGGTILKVPRVEAGMQTWQSPNSRQIDYIFKSALEGKVEVGWNYSRISYIRGMWANHSRALEQTCGRELPLTAIRLTGVMDNTDAGVGKGKKGGEAEQQAKITAEVTMPQSKYDYRALEPAVIETPQLRDMGEATPPLEWIGLHRDRLPNLTHQIVIVSLLELAGEVEDAYARILGSH
ncbi:fermentation associated protein [Grosmannia clavigera kw1407]|uniref:Fermentation associated protein n=1 Tax=Grosmannia clavigera (strain kw1407 / UAMH 11150) TaxID=655863 RepID=F0XGD4_GROCL|nr:fermentation associated protein [Grosmannia clavigera kw1407]EFX02611.1 fermentation associated protein [Grosmannia clavigera kw1407]